MTYSNSRDVAVTDRALRPSLIINGDDFGLSLATNRAIIEAHRNGVLTSASLMVNEGAAQDAVLQASKTPTLAVGLHLSLVLGKSSLPPTAIPSIVDSRGSFSNSPLVAGLKYFFGPQARRDVRREMRAQFERFAATGLPFSHVDGHNHLHMHPVVFAELISLCEEFQVKRVRLVDGETRVHYEITGRPGIGQSVISRVFKSLNRHCHRQLDGRGFATASAVHGLFQSGWMHEQYLLELLERIPPTEVTEIYLHPLSPGASDAEKRDNPGGIGEFEALVSPRVRRAVESRGLRLATYQTI